MSLPFWVLWVIAGLAAWLLVLAFVVALCTAAANADRLDEEIERHLRGEG